MDLQEHKATIYLIGSLRNQSIPTIAERLRKEGYDVFDDWHAAGPDADDEWRRYEQERNHSFKDALDGYAAKHVYSYDAYHLHRADVGVLVLPAGKSGHLELGYLIGSGKPGFILLDDPDRWDVMYLFAKGVYYSVEGLIKDIDKYHFEQKPRSGAELEEKGDQLHGRRVRPYVDSTKWPVRPLREATRQDEVGG